MVKRTSQKRLKVVMFWENGFSWEIIMEKLRFTTKLTARTVYKYYVNLSEAFLTLSEAVESK